MEVYSLYKRIYLDKINKQYKTIISIDRTPIGILNKYIKKINNNKLSEFSVNNNYCYNNCILAILNDNNELLCIEELPSFISFLISNNYKIDYKLSKLLTSKNISIDNNINNNNILFYISYDK